MLREAYLRQNRCGVDIGMAFRRELELKADVKFCYEFHFKAAHRRSTSLKSMVALFPLIYGKQSWYVPCEISECDSESDAAGGDDLCIKNPLKPVQ